MTQPLNPFLAPNTTGFVRSFGHIRISIAGMDFSTGITKVTYKRERKRDTAYSAGPDPIGKSLGVNSYEAEIEMYFDAWNNFLLQVTNTLGPGYADQPFIVYVSYTGVNLTPITDTIQGCTVDTSEGSNEQGTKPLLRSSKLSPLKIYFNGLDDNGTPLQGASIQQAA